MTSAARARAPAPLKPAERSLFASYDQGDRTWRLGDPPSTATASKAAVPPLVAALPPGERPLLQPDLGAAPKVPRLTRQAVLDRLLQRELAAALEAPGGGALLGAAQTSTRRRCVEAALAAEAALLGRSSGKPVYLNLASQALAAPAAAQKAPAEASRPPGSLAALLEACCVLRGASAEFFAEAVAARERSLALLWTPPFYLSRDARPADPPQPAPAASAPAPAAAELPPVAEDAPPAPCNGEEGAILRAVTDFCAGILAPRLAAGELSPSEHEAVLGASVAKVCAAHPQAVDASFLERRAAKVTALVEAHVARAKWHRGRGLDAGRAKRPRTAE